MGQSAPGVLPWALGQADAATAKKGTNGKNGRNQRNRSGKKRGPSQQGPRRGPWGPVQALYGTAYFGLESSGSVQAATQARTDANNVGFNLEERGFLFDPRLWTHTLGMQMDRSAFNAPLQSTVANGLGLNFNGTLFGSRSFPLRIFFIRRTANTNFSGPADNRTSFRNLGLVWALNQPKLANVTLSALFGRTSTDAASAFLPFQERQQSLVATVSRSFHAWLLSGSADYLRVRSSLNGFQYILRGQELRGQRAVGQRGELTTSLHHLLRSESDRLRPSTRYALTTLQSSLTYRHSEKVHGFYNVSYLSNIREAAIFSALRSSTGAGGIGAPLEPNPALRQALLSPGRDTTLTGQAGWDYAVTPRLTFGATLAHSILGTPEIPTEIQGTLLKSYSTTGGSVNYHRPFGLWDTTWRASLLRNWNRPRRGASYADNGRSLGLGVARRLGRLNWMSNVSYSEYNSGLAAGILHRQERWANSLETRLTRRLNFNFGAELFHLDSNFVSLQDLTRNRENGLLLHGTFTNRSWAVTMGRGLRNVNSAVIGLDLANLLNAVLLSEVNPLATPLTNADRYTYAFGSYHPFRNLQVQGAYRRDNFLLARGDFNRYTDMDFSVAYRLRRVTVAVGYRRLQQETLTGLINRDLFYVRLGRPFRLL